MNRDTQIVNLVLKKALNIKIFKTDLEGINEEDLAKIENSFQDFTFKLAIAGKQGLGKSSTLNALFGLNLPVEHGIDRHGNEEIIKVEEDIKVEENIKVFPLSFEGKGKMIVYDLPGMQSTPEKDSRLIKDYNLIIPQCDIILWVLQPWDIQYAFDIKYINSLSNSIRAKMVIGISRIDEIQPIPTDGRRKRPTPAQEISILDKKKYISGKLKMDIDRIVAYSARGKGVINGEKVKERKHNLLELSLKILKYSNPENGFLFYSMLSESILKRVYRAIRKSRKNKK